MKRILVFQHVAYELLGTLNPKLKEAGFRIRYVNFGRHPHAEPGLEGYQGLVVLGGPMNVGQTEQHPHLLTEIRLIREAVERDMPVLGICLGAQLLASALGARVTHNPVKEIGWYDVTPTAEGLADPLLRHFGDTRRVFQWHGDRFEIPRGAVRLAGSPTCSNQAFRYGDSAYGLQFHPEVDEALINRWLTVPEHLLELAALHGSIDADEIRRETSSRIAESMALADDIFDAFIHLFQIRRARRRVLPSR